MKRNPKIKDLFTPEEGIFDYFPDTLWGDSLSKENLNAEFFFTLRDLYASRQTQYYLDSSDGMEKLSKYLYEKHYRQLEMIWTALNEEYNMFLTGRLSEERTYTRDESLTGSDTSKKTMNGLRTTNSDISKMFEKMGSIDRTISDNETYEDSNTKITEGFITEQTSGQDRQTDQQTKTDKSEMSGTDTVTVDGKTKTENLGTQDNIHGETTYAFNSSDAVPTGGSTDTRKDNLIENMESDSSEATKHGKIESVEGTLSNENVTDYGKMNSLNETQSDTVKVDGKRDTNHSDKTSFLNYQEVDKTFSNESSGDEGTEDVEGTTNANRQVVYSENLEREADSPLQTTQQLIREELEIRQTSFVDQMINILRQSTTLKVWR